MITASAADIAAAMRAGRTTARHVVDAALERIAARDSSLNSFTAVTAASARAEAERIDATIASGRDAGPLAGVPFAVKNLFDVAGLTTLAGSKINRDRPPATRDAEVVGRLRAAGAILVGAVNMDEYAYGFTTENTHYGVTRNPHDLDRVAGGSSGGSAAAVAAGLVPLALGSDTNGSIRVPAALCGVFGLKPTYGRVSRAGTVLFSPSLDHVGPFARSVLDVALAFDAVQGHDPADPVSSARPAEPTVPHLGRGVDGLRLSVADDYFARGAQPEALAVVDTVARALGVTRRVTFPEPQRARAGAMVITASEGASLHLDDLRTRAKDFDPMTRERFLAGAFIPATTYLQAQRFRAWYRRAVVALFQDVDVVLAPTTPWPAVRFDEQTIVVDGAEILARPNYGLFTQPLSFIGLPVLSVPVRHAGRLPLGVQLIGAPWTERMLLSAAAALERHGVVASMAGVDSGARRST